MGGILTPRAWDGEPSRGPVGVGGDDRLQAKAVGAQEHAKVASQAAVLNVAGLFGLGAERR